MGNSNTKESRQIDYPDGMSDGRDRRGDYGDISGRTLVGELGSRPRNRMSRGDLGFLGLGGNSIRGRDQQDVPFQHRETRAERDARRLERERALRARERERSIQEEHVDGGYLVTLGTYTGTEDFSKPVVRQLQVIISLAKQLRRSYLTWQLD